MENQKDRSFDTLMWCITILLSVVMLTLVYRETHRYVPTQAMGYYLDNKTNKIVRMR